MGRLGTFSFHGALNKNVRNYRCLCKLHRRMDVGTIIVKDGNVDRTTSGPNSALRLKVEKDQGLRSGMLS